MLASKQEKGREENRLCMDMLCLWIYVWRCSLFYSFWNSWTQSSIIVKLWGESFFFFSFFSSFLSCFYYFLHFKKYFL
jgi:hypothetical protein